METPEIWAQICIQRMVELAKESTTMRLILDPMFVYFDTGRHWVPRHGLATMVLSVMSYFLESSGDLDLCILTLFLALMCQVSNASLLGFSLSLNASFYVMLS